MDDCARMVTEELSKPGPVDRNRARQLAEGFVVRHDRVACRRTQPALGILEAGLDAVGLAVPQERPSVRVTQHGPPSNQLVGQPFQPMPHDGVLPLPTGRRDCHLDQASRAFEVLAGHGVPDGFGRFAVVRVPLASSPM
jgi:hypothetical protein